MDWDEGCWGRGGAFPPPLPRKCCGISTCHGGPGGQTHRTTRGLVSFKEVNGAGLSTVCWSLMREG